MFALNTIKPGEISPFNFEQNTWYPFYKVINRSTVFNSQRVYNRTRKSDCLSNGVRVNKVLQLIQIGMVAKCVLLCGDIALNPGPLNLRVLQRHKGLSLCH